MFLRTIPNWRIFACVYFQSLHIFKLFILLQNTQANQYKYSWFQLSLPSLNLPWVAYQEHCPCLICLIISYTCHRVVPLFFKASIYSCVIVCLIRCTLSWKHFFTYFTSKSKTCKFVFISFSKQLLWLLLMFMNVYKIFHIYFLEHSYL